jgi:hypothetical protein
MRPNDPVRTITGVILRESTKAIQMKVTGISGIDIEEEPSHWFPFSQVQKIMRNTGGQDELVVSEWILSAKELI